MWCSKIATYDYCCTPRYVWYTLLNNFHFKRQKTRDFRMILSFVSGIYLKYTSSSKRVKTILIYLCQVFFGGDAHLCRGSFSPLIVRLTPWRYQSFPTEAWYNISGVIIFLKQGGYIREKYFDFLTVCSLPPRMPFGVLDVVLRRISLRGMGLVGVGGGASGAIVCGIPSSTGR